MFSLKYSPFVLCAMVRYDNSHMILMKEIITMKKLTAMALVLAMVLSLSSCGKSDGDSSAADNSKAETSAADTSAADEGSESETEAETEPETEADPYAGMTQLKLDEDYNGINASIYIPKWEFELSSSSKDNHWSMSFYKCTEESMSSKMTVKMSVQFISESQMESDKSGYEAYTGNDNGYDAVYKYNEDTSSATYKFYKGGGPDGNWIKFSVDLGSLFSVEKEDLDELFDVIGKSATIEGEYSDTASAENENGELTTDDGWLTFTPEIEVKGQKVSLEKTAINGYMRIEGETPEIDGVPYRITVYGKSDQSSYDNLLNGEYTTDKFGKETVVADYTAAALVYIREGRLNSNYFVKLDDEHIVYITVDALKGDFDTNNDKLENDYDATAAYFDEIVTDILKSATVTLS